MSKRKLWGGFVNDKLDIRDVDTGWGGWGESRERMPAIFTSRAAARRQYEDVRPVSFVEGDRP